MRVLCLYFIEGLWQTDTLVFFCSWCWLKLPYTLCILGLTQMEICPPPEPNFSAFQDPDWNLGSHISGKCGERSVLLGSQCNSRANTAPSDLPLETKQAPGEWGQAPSVRAQSQPQAQSNRWVRRR